MFRQHRYVLMEEPKAKLSNRRRDLMRWARKYDLPFRMPERFPIKTSVALRGALASRRFEREQAYLFALFSRYWEHNDPSIATLDGLRPVAVQAGMDPVAFAERADSAEVRQQLIDLTQSALDRGVFGAPSMLVGNELFWGKDRMDFVEDALRAEAAGSNA